MKIGIDTNVLIRLLVNDNPEQRKAVLAFGEQLGTSYEGFVTLISLVEMDWALRKQYGYSRDQSATALRKITQLRGVEVQARDSVVSAIDSVERGAVEFSDALIAHLCVDAGCDRVVTLDRKAGTKIPVMEYIG